MSAVSERHVRPLFQPLLPPSLPESTRRRRWWRYGLALALGGYLLFAHGCHGDEDNELFAHASSGRMAGHGGLPGLASPEPA